MQLVKLTQINVKIARKEERSMWFCKLGQYLYNLMLIACLNHWNNSKMSILVYSSAIPVDSCGFLPIPADSSGMDPFLQESVGHGEVLINPTNSDLIVQANNPEIIPQVNIIPHNAPALPDETISCHSNHIAEKSGIPGPSCTSTHRSHYG